MQLRGAARSFAEEGAPSSLSEIDQNAGRVQPLGNRARPTGLINLSRPDDVPLIRVDVHYRYPRPALFPFAPHLLGPAALLQRAAISGNRETALGGLPSLHHFSRDIFYLLYVHFGNF